MPHWAKSDCDDMYSSTQSGTLGTGSNDIDLVAVDSDKWDSISFVPGTNLTTESSVKGEIGSFFWFLVPGAHCSTAITAGPAILKEIILI